MCLDARLHARWTFIECAGARAGAAVRGAAWGVDRSEVVAKAPQREVTCQDSFRACEGTAAARLALAALAPDLVRRMDEEFHEHERVARRLVVRWRERRVRRETNRAGPTSVSLPMPPAATDARLETETRADAVVSAAAGALANALPKTFNERHFSPSARRRFSQTTKFAVSRLFLPFRATKRRSLLSSRTPPPRAAVVPRTSFPLLRARRRRRRRRRPTDRDGSRRSERRARWLARVRVLFFSATGFRRAGMTRSGGRTTRGIRSPTKRP